MAMSRTGGHVRVVWIAVVDAVAALLLVGAAVAVPWATLKDEVTGVTTVFRGGPLSLMLVTFAVCVVALALLTLVWPAPVVYGIQAAAGALAVVVSVALALSKIALANQTVQAGTITSVTGSGTALGGTHATTTAYALGGAVAVAAAGTILVASLIGLANSQVMGRSDPLADDLRAPAPQG
jgi:hypothetical protein